MGYEYNINFNFKKDNEVSELLESVAYFKKVEIFQNRNQYIYRLPENLGQMPSACAEIQTKGIYFCDNGGGKEILKEIIFRIGLSYKNLELIDHSD